MGFDVIVIGGNFAGISAAMQLVRARRNVGLIDAGQPRNRFAHASHGFFGQDGRTPAEIQQIGREQLLAYPTFTMIEGEAISASGELENFTVTLASGEQVQAARLILATGVRDELPEIPGLAERWGQTVLHCPYCHGYELGDRPLGILAAHPMSVHQALLVRDWGKVTLFTQGVFEPEGDDLVRLNTLNIPIERSPIVTLHGNTPDLEQVELADGRLIPIGALFTAAKLHQASPLAEELGCVFEEGPFGSHIQVTPDNRTSVPGVFAAGDAVIKMQNATLASASGVMAGVGTHRSLLGMD